MSSVNPAELPSTSFQSIQLFDPNDHASIYAVWLRSQGYPRPVTADQRRQVIQSSWCQLGATLDLILWVTLLVAFNIWAGPPLNLLLVPLSLLGLRIGFDFWDDYRKQTGLTGPLSALAQILGLRKARIANLPPPMSQVDFDSIEVLEPVATYLARPLIEQAMRAADLIMSDRLGFEATLHQISELTQEIAEEMHGADNQWKAILTNRLQPLSHHQETLKEKIKALKNQETTVRQSVSQVSESMLKLQRYRSILRRLDTLDKDRGSESNLKLEAVERFGLQMSVLQNAMTEFNLTSASYMNAKAEIDGFLIGTRGEQK